MADVLLIFPGQRVSAAQNLSSLHLPYALLCLAAYLREHQITTQIVDLRLDPIDDIDLQGVQYVGFSCMTGHQIKYALEAAQKLRLTLPSSIPFIWGGIHPSLHPEETVRHHLVDLVVIGEGEETLLDIILTHRKGDSLTTIPNLMLEDKGVILRGPERKFLNMDELPLPAYDLINIDRYPNILNAFDYQTSRGCPFRCSFCYNVEFASRRWRSKSPSKVVDEMQYVIERYGVKGFGLVDDEFFIKLKRAEGILDLIIERQLNINWVASCRLDLCRRFTPEMFTKLKLSGCEFLFLGAESGSEQMLSTILKDIKVEDIIEGCRLCIQNDLLPVVSFMGGFPDETIEQLHDTLDLIDKLWAISPRITVNGIFPFSPYPGTPLFNRSKELGLVPPDNLEGWGEWNFKYTPDHPWLSPRHRQELKIAFYIVRFKYYLIRYNQLPKNKRPWYLNLLINWGTLPLQWSAAIRFKKHRFSFAPEWELWALLARKTFGFL